MSIINSLSKVKGDELSRKMGMEKMRGQLENLSSIRDEFHISKSSELYVAFKNSDMIMKPTIFSVDDLGGVKQLNDGRTNNKRRGFSTNDTPHSRIDSYNRDYQHLISESELKNYILDYDKRIKDRNSEQTVHIDYKTSFEDSKPERAKEVVRVNYDNNFEFADDLVGMIEQIKEEKLQKERAAIKQTDDGIIASIAGVKEQSNGSVFSRIKNAFKGNSF